MQVREMGETSGTDVKGKVDSYESENVLTVVATLQIIPIASLTLTQMVECLHCPISVTILIVTVTATLTQMKIRLTMITSHIAVMTSAHQRKKMHSGDNLLAGPSPKVICFAWT